jgi:osmotically-inducible protein OsmY
MAAASEETVRSVRAALAAEPRVDLAHRALALRFQDGVLTIEGEVPDVAAKKLALEGAARTPAVHQIVDRLRVAPARRMSDAEIRDHLCDALVAEPAFRGCELRACSGRAPMPAPPPPPAAGSPARHYLDVAVDDGVVTLDGEVPSLAHKRLAGVLAWWVPGTRDVVNGLEVLPPEEDDDGEVGDAVRIALEKDPLLDAGDVGVAVRGGEVVLSGAVASPDQREAAEMDAWYVFGVDRVSNRLRVRPLER